MTLGPIDFIALEFPSNQFKGEILPDLFELVDQGTTRIAATKQKLLAG
jgi:hypothetical protein